MRDIASVKAYDISEVLQVISVRDNVRDFLKYFIDVSSEIVGNSGAGGYSIKIPPLIYNEVNTDIQFYHRYFFDVLVKWLSGGNNKVKRDLHGAIVYGGKAWDKKMGYKAEYTEMLMVVFNAMYRLFYGHNDNKMIVYNSCLYSCNDYIVNVDVQAIKGDVINGFGLDRDISNYLMMCEAKGIYRVDTLAFGYKKVSKYVADLKVDDVKVPVYNNLFYQDVLFGKAKE